MIAHGTEHIIGAYNIKGAPLKFDGSSLFLSFGQDAEIRVEAPPSKWLIKRPLPLDYDNSLNGVREISYEEVELVELYGINSFQIQQVPELKEIGTHELVAIVDGREIQVQIVVRRNDSYIGYLTELIGVPFVYGPGFADNGHQTDQRKGADCVALAIYGRRRLGQLIPYVSPPKLYDYTDELGTSVHIDKININEGDLLHFGFQTAVITIDNPPVNRLSDNDLIIHSYHKLAEEIPFSQLPYKSSKFRILRWKK